MMKQIFLSRRAEPIPRWREAFPTAEIIAQGAPGKGALPSAGNALIWLHIQQGIDVVEQLQPVIQTLPDQPIVVLSNDPNDDEALAALSNGAVGYCNSLAAPEMLRQVAQVVEAGGLWVGAGLLQRLVRAMSAKSRRAPSDKLAQLSPREREVALAVAQGASNKEIARSMAITERTVKAHLSAIFDKLGVRDRLQLTLMIYGPPGG